MRSFAIDIYYLLYIASDYFSAAKILKKSRDGEARSSDSLQSVQLLMTTSLELFLKAYIAIRVLNGYHGSSAIEEDIREEIKKRQSKRSHDITKIFKDYDDLMQSLEVVGAERVINDFVNVHRIQLKDCVIDFIDSEAVRFGSFAKDKNVFVGNDIEKALNFLEKVQEFTRTKNAEYFSSIKKDRT